MKKTGLEIVEMIAKGKAPKKIYLICDEAEWELVDGIHYCYQKAADDIYDLDIIEHLNDEFEIIEEYTPKTKQDMLKELGIIYNYVASVGKVCDDNIEQCIRTLFNQQNDIIERLNTIIEYLLEEIEKK